MAAASAKRVGKKADFQPMLSCFAGQNGMPPAMSVPGTLETGIGRSQTAKDRDFRWIERAREDGIDMKRFSGDVRQKRQRLSVSGEMQPRHSFSPLDGSTGWLRAGSPEASIDGLQVGPPAEVMANTGTTYETGKNAGLHGYNQLRRGTATTLSKRFRRSERMQNPTGSDKALPLEASQQPPSADATIRESDGSKVGGKSQETIDAPRSETGTSIENFRVTKELELTKHARNPQFAFVSPRLVSLAQTAAQEGLSQRVVWKALFGQNSPTESVATEMYAFHQDLADGHSFANYPNRKDTDIKNARKATRGFNSWHITRKKYGFVKALWTLLDGVARKRLHFDGQLKTVHFFQQQYAAGHFPPHNDHSERANLTIVVVLHASSPDIPDTDQFLATYTSGISFFKSMSGDAYPTVFFCRSFDAIAFPSLCVHATDIPVMLPESSMLLKAALFYEVNRAAFETLFPGQRFIRVPA